MQVVLIRPPQFIFRQSFAMNSTPPLGLAFVAAAIKAAGYRLTVIDAIGEAPEQINPVEFSINSRQQFKADNYATVGLSITEIIRQIPPDVRVIGISSMFSNNWLSDRHVIETVGKHFPNAVIVAGGESISAKPELWLQQTQELDVCVIGEGEETITDLLQAVKEGRQLSTVQGIAYKAAGGHITATPRRTRVRKIDELPLPAWELFPLENYEKHEVKWSVTPRKSLPVMATRGCPYECTFCSSPHMWGTRYYMRSPQHVADEIQDLQKRYGIGHFDFFDLTAIINKRWIIEFSDEIQKRGLDITWQMPAGTRSEAIDIEVAKSLQLSGCTSVTYAPESGSARMLDIIKKKVSLKNMLQSMRHTNQEGMHIFINMILGLPDEKHTDVWRTLWFMVQCSWVGVNELGIAKFQPYPGSVLFDRMLQENKVQLTTDDYFIDAISLTAWKRSDYYNNQIKDVYYRVYFPLMYLIFYSTNFLFRPVRLWNIFKNIVKRKYSTRSERALVKLLERTFKPKQATAH